MIEKHIQQIALPPGNINVFKLYLYFSFFIFIISMKYANIASMHAVISILFAIKLKTNEDYFRITRIEFASFLILSLVILLIPITGINWREMAFFTQFIFLIWVFNTHSFEIKDFIVFINITYVIYSLLSYLVYFGVIIAGFSHTDLNQFDRVNIGMFDYILPFNTLIGFEGSTAGIDSYSMIIVLINLIYFKDIKHPIAMIIIASLNIVLAARLTPFFLLLIAILYTVIPTAKKKIFVSVVVSIFFFSPFIHLLFIKLGIGNSLFYDLLTHGRAGIWEKYYNILYNADISNVFFGFNSHRPPTTYIANRANVNPHSSFLRLILSLGIPLYLILWSYFIHSINKISYHKSTILILAVFTAGITNVNIIYNQNPIWLFILFFFPGYSKLILKDHNHD